MAQYLAVKSIWRRRVPITILLVSCSGVSPAVQAAWLGSSVLPQFLAKQISPLRPSHQQG